MVLIRIGIVGTGPSGLYLGKYLYKTLNNFNISSLKTKDLNKNTNFNNLNPDLDKIKLHIDFFDRKKSILGLFDYGLAPDKLNIKLNSFNLLTDQFRYFTNINIGSDLKLDDLLKHYNYVILCLGCTLDKQFDITNQELGVFDSLDVIKYYNKDFLTNYNYYNYLRTNNINIFEFNSKQLQGFKDKTCNTNTNSNTDNTSNSSNKFENYIDHLIKKRNINISVLGGGNVSLDIVRIFTKSISELRELRVSEKFTDFLSKININKITLFIRSNLLTNKFTNSELNELYLSSNNTSTSDSNSSSTNKASTTTSNKDNLKSESSVNYIISGDSLSNHNNTNNYRQLTRKLQLFDNLVKLNSSSLTDNSNKTEVEFKFNTRIDSISNLDGHINSVDYSYTTTNNTGTSNTDSNSSSTNKTSTTSNKYTEKTDLLIKCIGYRVSEDNLELLKKVDNKFVYSNGWVNSGCSGDLNKSLINSINLSNLIKNNILNSLYSFGSSNILEEKKDILPFIKHFSNKSNY